MTTLRIVADIPAPVELCFDLSRSIDLHLESMIVSRERAVGGGHVRLDRCWPTGQLGGLPPVEVRLGLDPLGPVAEVFAAAYLLRLLVMRNATIKRRAEEG